MISGIPTAPVDDDVAHWQECSYRYKGANGEPTGVLQLATMQAAIIRGDVDLKTEVEIRPPGHPPEAFEALGELFDGYGPGPPGAVKRPSRSP
jgi:hypothetical protein